MFRMIVEGTAKDYQAFTTLAARACAIVEEHEPGMLTYECYSDEATRRFTWLETYADVETFIAHSQNMEEAGVMEEAAKIVEFDRVTVLGRVTDARVKAFVDQVGGAEQAALVGVTR